MSFQLEIFESSNKALCNLVEVFAKAINKGTTLVRVEFGDRGRTDVYFDHHYEFSFQRPFDEFEAVLHQMAQASAGILFGTFGPCRGCISHRAWVVDLSIGRTMGRLSQRVQMVALIEKVEAQIKALNTG